MNFRKIALFLLVFNILFFSCNNNDDDVVSVETPNDCGVTPTVQQINNFVYRGLRVFYLYKDQQPALANDRFNSAAETRNFTNSQCSTPEAFFEELTIPKDRFSFIVDDFERLEQLFDGINVSPGMKFFGTIYDDSNNALIAVTQILPGGPAEKAGIKRGMLFNRIDGIQLNRNNFSDQISKTSYTLGKIELENGVFTETDETFDINEVEIKENPIAISKILEVDGKKIGYLLYSGFIDGSEEELNAEFLKFKSQNITDLVLDLRYNGGGSVRTAIALGGMITGQFNGQVFLKQKWNSDNQAFLEESEPESLIEKFKAETPKGSKLNSLGLNKLYVITTKSRTASASELVPNSLSAHIDVVIIGDEEGTVGKSQASRTVYDSPSFAKGDSNRDKRHKYAMQPLIYEVINKNDIGVPTDGLVPDIIAEEELGNFGILGEANEPLLAKAIEAITGSSVPVAKNLNTRKLGKIIGSEDMNQPNFQRMYDNK